MANASFVQPVNFMAAGNPDLSNEAKSLERQQALAQEMLSQGMAPIQQPQTPNGGFTPRISPWEGAAKMAQTYLATQMQKRADEKQSKLADKQMQYMINLLRGGQAPTMNASAGGSSPLDPSGPNPSVMAGGGQQPYQQASMSPQPQPQPGQRSPLSVTGDPSKDMGLIMAGQMFGPTYGGMLAKQYEPTEVGRMLSEAGIDPNSPQGKSAFNQKLFPPVNVRPGGTVYQPGQGPVYYAPQLPPNSAPINPQNPAGGVAPIPGASNVVQSNAAAQASGQAPYQFENVTTPTGAQVPVSRANLAQGNGPAMGQGPAGPAGRPGGMPSGIGQSTFGKEYSQAAAKSSSEYVDHLRGQAQDSVDQNRMLDELEGSLKDFGPGKAAAVRKAIAQWRVQAGLASDDDKRIAASAETGDKLVGQLVSNALKKLSARPTQMEFQIFKDQFVPNLAMTPRGSQAVINFMRQQNNLSMQKYEGFNKWRRQQPTDTDFRDFDLYWNPQAATAPLSSTQSFPFKDVKNDGAQPQAPKTVNWQDLRGR